MWRKILKAITLLKVYQGIAHLILTLRKFTCSSVPLSTSGMQFNTNDTKINAASRPVCLRLINTRINTTFAHSVIFIRRESVDFHFLKRNKMEFYIIGLPLFIEEFEDIIGLLFTGRTFRPLAVLSSHSDVISSSPITASCRRWSDGSICTCLSIESFCVRCL